MVHIVRGLYTIMICMVLFNVHSRVGRNLYTVLGLGIDDDDNDDADYSYDENDDDDNDDDEDGDNDKDGASVLSVIDPSLNWNRLPPSARLSVLSSNRSSFYVLITS